VKSILVSNDADEWFQYARELKDEKGKVYAVMSPTELLISMLNIWEAGNLVDNIKFRLSNKIFPHENGKFYRGSEGSKVIHLKKEATIQD